LPFPFISSFLFAQNLPSYLPADGLVGWWPFNGNANDESGNGNDGVVVGATLTSDLNGNPNQAYFFTGSNTRIEIPHTNSINVQTVSIRLLAKPTTYLNSDGNQSQLVSKREWTGWGNSYEIGIGKDPNQDYGNNASNAIYSNLTLNGLNSTSSIVNANLIDGNWNDIVYTHDSEFIRFYINGEKVYEIVSPGIIPNGNELPVWFGGRPGPPGRSFYTGTIDDIAIYNRALTQEEITALYTGTPVNGGGGNTSANAVPPGIPFQAVVRNANGNVAANTAVTTRFTLHQTTADGTVEFQETHALTTNAQGLMSTVLGQGTAVQNTFAAINWANTTKFLQVEVNLVNGYVDLGTQQLMSVPFAMYAANGPQGIQGPAGTSVQSVVQSSNQWVITFSDGSTTTFPIGNGNSATNSQTFHYLSDGF
jgi:hypothetical protein